MSQAAPAAEHATAADRDGIIRLVQASGLPTVGLAGHSHDGVVIRQAGALVGCAVVERYGPFGLLRSVAVTDEMRGRGLGVTLVDEALARARASGLERLYLLTETAAPFFARFGFQPVTRHQVPDAVQASVEFTSACPAGALAMTRPAADRPPADPGTRAARLDDAAAMAAIYNEGIEDRLGTFETRFRTAADVAAWFDGRHPLVVVVENGRVEAFAATFPYRPRECYAGVAEFSVYVRRAARGRGLGRLAMVAIIEAADAAGYWKLVSRVFVENAASRRLLAAVGFREVGIYERHARLDDCWRDVVVVERLIGPAA